MCYILFCTYPELNLPAGESRTAIPCLRKADPAGVIHWISVTCTPGFQQLSSTIRLPRFTSPAVHNLLPIQHHFPAASVQTPSAPELVKTYELQVKWLPPRLYFRKEQVPEVSQRSSVVIRLRCISERRGVCGKTCAIACFLTARGWCPRCGPDSPREKMAGRSAAEKVTDRHRRCLENSGRIYQLWQGLTDCGFICALTGLCAEPRHTRQRSALHP